jgi:hypothetical protein
MERPANIRYDRSRIGLNESLDRPSLRGLPPANVGLVALRQLQNQVVDAGGLGCSNYGVRIRLLLQSRDILVEPKKSSTSRGKMAEVLQNLQAGPSRYEA